MSIAIHTKYIPATDMKPARISATALRNDQTVRVYVSIDYDLDGTARHAKAARALLEKVPYVKAWGDHTMRYCGETLDGRGFVFSVGSQLAE